MVESGGRRLLKEEILPHLDNFIGQGFDKVCVEILQHLITTGKMNLDYDRAGRWWGGNEEIDLVAMSGDNPVFAAECKWSRKPIGIDVLRKLQRKVSLITFGGSPTRIRLGLFSRSGFTKEIDESGRKGEIELINVRKIGL